MEASSVSYLFFSFHHLKILNGLKEASKPQDSNKSRPEEGKNKDEETPDEGNLPDITETQPILAIDNKDEPKEGRDEGRKARNDGDPTLVNVPMARGRLHFHFPAFF